MRDNVFTNNLGYAINITNACDISVSAIEAYGQTYSSGADITIDQTGSMTVLNSVNCRGIAFGVGGILKITGGGITAGTLTAGGLVTGGQPGSARMDVQNYKGLVIGTSGLNSSSTDAATNNNLTISNIGADGITVSGQVTSTRTAGSGYGHVVLNTYGSVSISNVNARGISSYGQQDGGNITITAGTNITAIGSLDAVCQEAAGYARYGGNITLVASNGTISVKDLWSYNNSSISTYPAGNISLTAYGDITVSGTISAKMTVTTTATNKYGQLNLTATGPGSKITVANLDLTSFRTNAANTFDAAGSNSYITGIISNYTSKGTNSLRLAAGQIVWYNATLAGNAYLNAADYVMVGGGTLMHSGTVSSTRTTLPEFVNQLGYDNQL